LGKDAHIAATQSGDDTKRRSGTAVLLAALWPSLLGPEHGDAWRMQNRRIWRRRLTHVALVAAITGISAVAAAPPFHPPGEAEVPQNQVGGRGEHGHRGPAGSATGGGPGFEHLLIALHGHDVIEAAPPPGLQVTPENVGEHGEDAAQGPRGHERLQPPWEPDPYSPTLAHFTGGGFGGNGGGGGGGGGSGGGGGGGGSGASPGDSGDPGQQTRPGAPDSPKDQDQPPYIVDPDDGPDEPSDPQWPPKDTKPPTDWPPQTSKPQSPLSPVPEPQTWLMMIGGFGAIGASLRTRRRTGACCTR
jgi:hypothetical protein